MGARLCRGGCGSVEVGDSKGRHFAPITLVREWVRGATFALTRFHDGSAELSAFRTPPRTSPAPDSRRSRSHRGRWRSEAAYVQPRPVVGRRSRIRARPWAAYVQPRTVVGRRSSARITAVGGLCPAQDGRRTLRGEERVAIGRAPAPPARISHGPRLGTAPTLISLKGCDLPAPEGMDRLVLLGASRQSSFLRGGSVGQGWPKAIA